MAQTVFELPSGWESTYNQPDEQQDTGSSQTVFEIPEDVLGSVGVDYQPERNTVFDILSNLWAGTGEALDIYGASSDTVRDAGKYILGTEFAQPDQSQYLKQQGYGNEIFSSAARSIPLSIPMYAAGVGGFAVAGPPGATAGAIGAAGLLARGLREKSLERWQAENPEGDIADGERYANLSTAVEVLTELAATGVDIFTLKAGGQLTKAGIKAAAAHEIFGSVESVVEQTARRMGPLQFFGKVAGASSMEGMSEVAAEKLQSELDQKYGMKIEAPDYFKTFLVGATVGLAFNAGANLVEANNRDKIYDNLTKGLTSEDVEQRKYMANQIYETMAKASPEAAQTWRDYAELNVDRGPLYLEELVTKDSSWKLNVKKQEQAGILNQITTDPTSILKEAGIPTNPYGNSPAEPPPLSMIPGESSTEERDILLEKIAASGKVRKEAQFSTQIPGPDYIEPYNPYSMSKALKEVDPESNNVVPPEEPVAPSRLWTLQHKAKLTIKEKKELKTLYEAEPVVTPAVTEPIATEPIVAKEEPVVSGTPLNVAEAPKVSKDADPTDLIYTKQDLNGLKVKILKGQTKSGKKVYKEVDAHRALSDIDEEIRLYEDIMRCASK